MWWQKNLVHILVVCEKIGKFYRVPKGPSRIRVLPEGPNYGAKTSHDELRYCQKVLSSNPWQFYTKLGPFGAPLLHCCESPEGPILRSWDLLAVRHES
jgi:hypothetical protein